MFIVISLSFNVENEINKKLYLLHIFRVIDYFDGIAEHSGE